MVNETITKSDNEISDNNFILPEGKIKRLQFQLHSVPEIGENFTHTISFVTYKLSSSTSYGSSSFKEFSSKFDNSEKDLIICNKLKGDTYHSIRKGSSGVTWIIPKSSVESIVPNNIAKTIKVFVNFDENDIESSWYILDFYYDIISVVDKNKKAGKLKSLVN